MINKIPNTSISFKIFTNNLPTIKKKTKILKQYNNNIFIKIPIITTTNKSTLPLIKHLSSKQIKLNITTIYTIKQIKTITNTITKNIPTYISIFTKHITNTKINPLPLIKKSIKITHNKKNIQLL